MRKKRYNYSSEEKVIILKRHLVDRETVSDLCDEYQLHLCLGKSSFSKREQLPLPLRTKTPRR